MKILRESMALALALALALPTWGAGDVIGVAVQSQSATVRQAKLTSGSTVYSGDSISAGQDGRAQVSIAGGGRVDVLSNSSVRVERGSEGVEMTLEHGTAFFQTVPDSRVTAMFPDARVRAPKGGSAMGIIGMESPTSALIVAKIGTLEVISEHDSRSVTVPEGSAARITLLPDDAPGQGPIGVQGAGRSSHRLAVILLIAGGAGTAGAILAVAGGGSNNSTPVSPSTP